MSTTKNGRTLFHWVVRFSAPDLYGGTYQPRREVMAVNEYQARKKAEGIAKNDGWTLISVGRA